MLKMGMGDMTQYLLTWEAEVFCSFTTWECVQRRFPEKNMIQRGPEASQRSIRALVQKSLHIQC